MESATRRAEEVYMAMKKDLVDQKMQKDIMRGILLDATPRVMRKTVTFMNDNLEGVEDEVLDDDGQPVKDSKGKIQTTMSQANLERMKLAHKLAHKFVDKMMPTESKVVIEETKTVSPIIAEAISRVVAERRVEKEKKAVDAEYSVVDMKEQAIAERNKIQKESK